VEKLGIKMGIFRLSRNCSDILGKTKVLQKLSTGFFRLFQSFSKKIDGKNYRGIIRDVNGWKQKENNTKRYRLMPEGDGKNPSISLRQETFIIPKRIAIQKAPFHKF